MYFTANFILLGHVSGATIIKPITAATSWASVLEKNSHIINEIISYTNFHEKIVSSMTGTHV